MTFEEFWELYTSQDLRDLYDEIIAVFSETLSEEVHEEYDVGEVIIEFVGSYETAKKFDEIQALARILKEHNPQVYDEMHFYLNDALVKYYCYTRNTEALQEVIQEFLTQPLDYDVLLLNFYRLVYYQHQELANRIIEDKYEEVQASKNLMQGAEYDLAMVKQFMLLETMTEAVTDRVEEADWQQFKQAAGKYGFEFEEIYRQNVEKGVLRPQALIERMQEGFPKEEEKRTEIVSALSMTFSQAMKAHHMSFAISGIIWNHLHDYWESQTAKNWQDFFRISEQKFEEFVHHKGGIIMDYRLDMALILWGSYYVLDFLHDQGLLTEQSYAAQQATLTRIKRKFMDGQKYSLWDYNFVHDWTPPRRINPEGWQSEKEAFAHSFTLISEYQALKDIDFPDLSVPENSTSSIDAPAPKAINYMPASVDKIGRNEKVSVRYEDGTVKKDIKYKKVADDLSAGRCELL